jgi:hypothetical protein
VGGDVSVNSKSLLVTDFMNLKIKLTQSFRCAHMNRVCVRMFIGVSAHTYMSICVCTVFLKKLPNILFGLLLIPDLRLAIIYQFRICEDVDGKQEGWSYFHFYCLSKNTNIFGLSSAKALVVKKIICSPAVNL